MWAWYRHLAIVSRAVHFQNLTAASQNVGLSQPQLSRLVKQLEDELGVTLLDRGVRRKTNWTPIAHRLAQAFDHSEHRFRRSLQEVLTESLPSELRAGCLEGLAPLAVQQVGRLSERRDSHWRMLQLDVLDQNDLEERFLAGDMDVIWTVRIPGKSKPRHLFELGFQKLVSRDTGKATDLLSTYEYGQKRKVRPGRLQIVSNSLRVRELWLESNGGRGRFPSSVLKERGRDEIEVLLLGNELLPEVVWQELTQLTLKS